MLLGLPVTFRPQVLYELGREQVRVLDPAVAMLARALARRYSPLRVEEERLLAAAVSLLVFAVIRTDDMSCL